MTTKQNPETPPGVWYVVYEPDGHPAMLEGRPAIFEAVEHAERARKRCSRPAHCYVEPAKLVPGPKVVVDKEGPGMVRGPLP